MTEGEGLDGLRVQVQEHERRLNEGDREHETFRQHYDKLGDRLAESERALADTERRLSDKQEAGFREIRGTVESSNRELRDHLNSRLDIVDQHLTKQDEKLDQRTSRWPPAAYIVGSAAATLAVSLVVAGVTHAFGL